MNHSFENIYKKLKTSKFRCKQKLNQKDKGYYFQKGAATIRRHARDFVESRLAPDKPKNDTKQTPFHGHPVFVAQHATGSCCRKCLSKWHNIERGRALTEEEVDYIVDLLMYWLSKEVQKS